MFIISCSSRPPAPPAEHARVLAWGAIDLNPQAKGKNTLKNSLGTAIAQRAYEHKNTNKKIPYNILVLSGGGSRGAFGAGLISGWDARGDMPKFDIITGISTGSIMAPFIFLGGDELEKMNHFYRDKTTEEVFGDAWDRFFNGGYFMNAKPLRKLFIETFNERFLEKVAQEHHNGRRFYVGTTNIDTGQLTVWDMGMIAASKRADKVRYFSDIIYASAAMPVYFPPQYMEVDIGDKKYYQMHIDGGIYSQLFMVGILRNWKEELSLGNDINTNFETTLYTIANRKYRQRDIYKPVKQKVFDIIEAYVLTEMDLLFDRSAYRLYKSCEAKGIDFKMASIPQKMQDIIKSPLIFQPEKMIQLYDLAYKQGLEGILWKESVSLDEYDEHQF